MIAQRIVLVKNIVIQQCLCIQYTYFAHAFEKIVLFVHMYFFIYTINTLLFSNTQFYLNFNFRICLINKRVIIIVQ